MTGSWTVREIALAELGTLRLLDGAPFQSGAGWWRAVAEGAMPPGARARFLLASRDGEPRVLFPVLAGRGGASALVTPYTCLFQPAFAATSDLEACAPALARRLGPVLRIDAIDPDWEGWRAFARGMRRAGHDVQSFAGFINWHERLAEGGWPAYLDGRPGALRSTIRRRLAHFERDPHVRFACHRDGAAAAAALDQFETVRARSWKPAEPYPHFARLFAREASSAGCFRISTLSRYNKPVAIQYWLVENGCAVVHKLVHDREFDTMSPGTALTAWTIRRLIEEEGISELDFGRGDDPYKKNWARSRRERGGLVVTDRRSVAGLAAAARQFAGPLVAHLLRGGTRRS